MERGAGLMAVLLGVLKAGGAYLALDLVQPAERLAFILEDAGPVLVVADALGAASVQGFPGQVIDVGSAAFAAETAGLPARAIEAGERRRLRAASTRRTSATPRGPRDGRRAWWSPVPGW
nr:AMP-binding protein [Actinomadura madurae]